MNDYINKKRTADDVLSKKVDAMKLQFILKLADSFTYFLNRDRKNPNISKPLWASHQNYGTL
jgi:hypothetical protein